MRVRVNRKEIRDFCVFLFLMYPSFRCLGFEMAYLGTGTPGYLRIWSFAAMLCAAGLLVCRHGLEKADIPVILYCGYILLGALVLKAKGQTVALTSLGSSVTAFFGTTYCVKQYGSRVIDYFLTLLGGLFVLEGIILLTPLNAPFVEDTVLTFIGHIQIYSMAWSCFAAFSLWKLATIPQNPARYIQPVRKLLLWGMLLYATVLSLFSGVAAVKIALVVFIAAYYAFRSPRLNQRKCLTLIFLAAMILNILVVFFQFQEHFAKILNLLGEEASLNGRTYIWSLFIPAIAKSPIFGYGYMMFGVVLENWGHTNLMDYCHNTILQEIINGGVVQLVLFVGLNLFAVKRLTLAKSKAVQHALFCGLCAMYVIMITESVTYYYYWNVLIALTIHIRYLDISDSRGGALPERRQAL